MKKKYTFRQMMKSITGRITILIATMILPVNLIALIFMTMNYLNTRERIEREIENTLETKAANLRTDIMSMKKSLLYSSFEETAVVELRDKSDFSNDRQYTLLQNVSDELKRQLLVQSTIKEVFYYFEKNDVYIDYGEVGIPMSKRSEYVKKTAAEMDAEGDHWNVIFENNVPALVLLHHTREFDYGLMVQLNFYSAKLRNTETKNRELFLGNADGSIISADGKQYLSSNNLTFEELDASSKYFLAKAEVKGTGLYLYELVASRELEGMTGIAWKVLLIILAAFTILVIPLLFFFIKKFVISPLGELNEAMDRIENGDTEYRLQSNATGIEFVHINQSFNSMLDQLNDLKIDLYEHQLEEKNVRMEYLSQQVQPHFILNALNILYSYEPEEYELSQKMIMCISKYFRHIVYANERFVLLKSEMEHIINYFEIQKARFPDLFYSIVEYDENVENALIPPLVVQTFVENSIKNSLKIGNQITIYLVAEKYVDEEGKEFLRIRMADTGDGISELILSEIEEFKKTGERQEHLGVGIQNTIERFKVLYQDKARINFSRDDYYPGTNVEIILPLHFS